MNRPAAGEDSMDGRLQIHIGRVRDAPRIEEAVRKRARRLERYATPIQRCQVWVEAPHGHHRKGRLHEVRIRITVPDEELTVDDQPAGDQVDVLIRNAFDAARRQLQDYARRRRGAVKTHRPAPQVPETKQEVLEMRSRESLKKRELEVRDLMTDTVFSLRPNDDLESLLDLMDTRHVRHVPIVDRDGNLVGLVTHRDLSRSALGPQDELPLSVQKEILRRRRIREIMATEVETVEPEEDLRNAAEMLIENKIGCLPVVEGEHLVGILTESDFVKHFVERG
jgi:CBS domain-containing membrane protein